MLAPPHQQVSARRSSPRIRAALDSEIEFQVKKTDSCTMTFASRQDAGRRLGAHLRDQGIAVDVVVGLPRGGVIVAAEAAHVLQRPLDLLVVRKIGHPFHREFAVGALAEQGVLVLDENVIGRNPRVRAELGAVIEEETGRLREYETRFHRPDRRDFTDKSIVLVDDGLATGATTEAAVLSARKQNARTVFVAVPVASTNAMERLAAVADQVIALYVDPDFDAVGRYYDVFAQTTDEEVLELLSSVPRVS
jgi:predicted phosphoribosyltransferase